MSNNTNNNSKPITNFNLTGEKLREVAECYGLKFGKTKERGEGGIYKSGKRVTTEELLLYIYEGLAEAKPEEEEEEHDPDL